MKCDKKYMLLYAVTDRACVVSVNEVVPAGSMYFASP